MNTVADAIPPGKKLDKSQLVKWVVYSLLLINWGYYFIEEMYVASHVLEDSATLLDWTREFATTIDNFAWFGLLFMFELETYILADETIEKRKVRWSIHGFRLICYLFLLHTVYARVHTYDTTFAAAQLEPPISSLCEVADRDWSFAFNVRYQTISSDNCRELSADTTFYLLEPGVVTDRAGFKREKSLVVVDVIDVLVWLLVIWSIELSVFLQNRNITGGRMMIASHAVKVFYLVLVGNAVYWISIGHWIYAWDQMLWILGFWAIENNLSEWRDEIRQTLGDSLPWMGNDAGGKETP